MIVRPTPWKRLQLLAKAEVRSAMRAMPPALREQVEDIPVVFEREPNRALVDDGYPEDILGLFVGLDYRHSESGAQELPPQVVLFLMNIWRYARENVRGYRAEVRKTYLHEVGHYLGLDEDDLTLRGME